MCQFNSFFLVESGHSPHIWDYVYGAFIIYNIVLTLFSQYMNFLDFFLCINSLYIQNKYVNILLVKMLLMKLNEQTGIWTFLRYLKNYLIIICTKSNAWMLTRIYTLIYNYQIRVDIPWPLQIWQRQMTKG